MESAAESALLGPASGLALSLCLLVVAMLRKFYSQGVCALGLSFIQELISRFRYCPKWIGRQAFACIVRSAQPQVSVPGRGWGSLLRLLTLEETQQLGGIMSSHPGYSFTSHTWLIPSLMKSVKSQPALPPDPAHSCHTLFRGRVQKPLFMPQAYNLCPFVSSTTLSS